MFVRALRKNLCHTFTPISASIFVTYKENMGLYTIYNIRFIGVEDCPIIGLGLGI